MGLDPKILAGIINTSSGRCWSSDTYNPVPGVIEGIPPSNGYQGGFGSALMAKVSFDQRSLTLVSLIRVNICLTRDTFLQIVSAWPCFCRGPLFTVSVCLQLALLLFKDLSLAQNASTTTQSPTPLGSLAHQIYRLLAQDPRYSTKDFGIVYQFLKDQK